MKPTNFHGVLRFFNSLAFRIERNANSRVVETQLAGVAHPRPVIADFAEFRFGVWLWMASAPDAHHQNRLSRETSPYLLQHQHNPVHWWPWGPDALATGTMSAGGDGASGSWFDGKDRGTWTGESRACP